MKEVVRMREQLNELKRDALAELENAIDIDILNEIRIKYLGKKGQLTKVLREMGSLSAEHRPVVGQLANDVRSAIEQLLKLKHEHIEQEQMNERLEREKIDVTLPGRCILQSGGTHPLTQMIQKIENIFIGNGFIIAEGPQVETDYYNFEALNLPKHHPARDMQDSFYLTPELLMRTHTSPVQVRAMEKMESKQPLKIICPGTVFRRDDDDATHSFQFHQIEGLVIGEGVCMSDLKGTLLQFAKEMFGPTTQIRLRPSFFPFTTPSVEVDVAFVKKNGERTWMEILGCGMVHPDVLRMGGYDVTKYTGFAFGMGVERIAMLTYGVDDIRHFYNNDLSFLKQFHRL